ncbi:MAG: lamin tail domain-containing protein [Saprospiraceae bacterium]
MLISMIQIIGINLKMPLEFISMNRIIHGTPGQENSVSCNNSEPEQSDLVFTEIMYNDGETDSLEFIEIYNKGTDFIDISNYILKARTINHTLEQGI